MYKKNKAAILIFTLLSITIISTLSFQLLRNTRVHSYFASTIVLKEQAKMLCFGGVNLAIAQLTQHLQEDNLKEKIKTDPDYKAKKMLSNFLPYLNKWQTFELQKGVDGINGELKIAVVSENGKINLNKRFFDEQKNEFKQEIVEELELIAKIGGLKISKDELKANIQRFFKNRKTPLLDLSELMEIEGFEKIRLFYEPPQNFKEKEQAQKRPVALSDYFTLWTNNDKVDPWLLSDAVCFAWNLRRPEKDDAIKRDAIFERVIKNYKSDLGKDWTANWNMLMPIYDKRLPQFNLVSGILSQQFAPQVFSVISCGKVQDVEECILVVFKIIEINKQTEEIKGKRFSNLYKIVKIYWL